MDYKVRRRIVARIAILDDYLGYVQSDGYSGYDHLSRNPDIIHMGCLAHARRKFVEVNKGRKKARGKKKSSQSVADEALDYIGYAVAGAKRMDALIKDLLLYSRVETHGAPLKAIDSEEALEGALDNLQAVIDDASAVVTFENLPVVMADFSQLMRLFQNLVENAVKYRDKDTPPEIHVQADAVGEGVVFSVRDNGIGIDPQFFNRIFVIFQRLHGRNEYSGTGIGLAVCKRIVERHGGRIWVESKAGEGCTFFFTMPTSG